MVGHFAIVIYVFSVFLGLSTVTGIVGWNPCRNEQIAERPAEIIAVGSYVYVHCGGSKPRSYLMQCPSQLVWNREVNGCSNFAGRVQSPPRLIGPVNLAGHPPDVAAASPNQGLQSFPAPELGRPLSSLVSGLSSALVRPSANAGSPATRLTVNPCVLDGSGTLSPIRFHPHPEDRSKYLECVPDQRTIVVRRCNPHGAAVWFQPDQRCAEVKAEATLDSEHHPDEGRHPAGEQHHHHHQPHRHQGADASRNLCRPGGQSFYRPHPTNQSLYVQCSMEGRAFVRECPRGLNWNQEAMTCDRSAPVTMNYVHPKT